MIDTGWEWRMKWDATYNGERGCHAGWAIELFKSYQLQASYLKIIHCSTTFKSCSQPVLTAATQPVLTAATLTCNCVGRREWG